MTDNISVFCIPNNIQGKRPRKPLVQIICHRDNNGQASICFTPKEAEIIAKRMMKSAKAAKDGRRLAEYYMEMEDFHEDQI